MTLSTSPRARARWKHRIALSLTTMLAGSLASPVLAQTYATEERQAPDENGVDVITGKVNVPLRSVSVGSGDSALAYSLGWAGGTYFDLFSTQIYPDLSNGYVRVNLFGTLKTFNDTGSGTTFVPTDGSGESISYNSTTLVYTYNMRDGTVISFKKLAAIIPNGPLAHIQADVITRPNGEALTFYYKTEPFHFCFGGCSTLAKYRVQSVTSTQGYQLKAQYVSNNGLDVGFVKLTSVMAINNAVDYCDPTADTCSGLTQSWPTLQVSESTASGTTTDTFTDPVSQTTTVTSTSTGVTSVTSPADAAADVSLTYDGNGRVATLTKGGGSWGYTYSDSGNTRTTTVTQPVSGSKIYTSDLTLKRVTSVTDELSHTTSFQYDSSGRLTRTTMPEGNYVALTYDARGNVTQTDTVAKAGASTITASAGYDSTCSNAKTCNQPNSTTDERGKVTDYTYDSTHGGILTVTAPAPTTGATRPQIRYGYAAKTAYYKNSAGSIVAAPSSVYKMTAISACQTGSSCSGTSDEAITTVDYGSTGVANNLLPVSITSGAGDGSLTTTTSATYDNVGNLLTVDGPLSGTADTVRYRYDNDRQIVGVASPDPDGGGSLKNRAQRTTYNGDGNVTKVELGTVNSQSDSDWTAMSVSESIETGYDSLGRINIQARKSGSTTYALTQIGYDVKGRFECVARRMNSAGFAAPPSSACTLDTPGSFGPDRITRTVYDSADEVTQIQAAYGTSDQANETSTYTDNGQVATATDAEGNKTSYTYDGFDRLSKTSYPNTGKGAGTSSSTDYEELIYDAGSNVTSRRLRGYNGDSSKHIDYTYDNLGRLTTKDLPNSEPDVSYTYDLLGRMTGASQTGNALTFTYDALGRNLTQGGPLGTVSMAYDPAGRRTSLTWPDSFYVSYDHLVTGEVSVIRENGASSGVGVLATYVYDDLGRRTRLTYGNGTVTDYGYDNISRLTSLALNLDGGTTTNDVTTTFGYSPANSIATQTRTNDLYFWDGHTNVARSYTSNGLNQLTASGATSLGYDARGNVTSAGSDSYGYSSENLLTSATVASVSASYEYDPMLRLSKHIITAPTTQGFLYDGTDLIALYSNTGSMTKRFVFGAGTDEPVVVYAGSGTGSGVRTFFHADERGSIVAQSSESGAKSGIYSYDEYGVPSAGNSSRFQYTGQAWMSQLGMYYYKARMYSPTLGRFMQTDPIGYGDGMNIYAYAGNDPVNVTDPFGLEGCKTRSGVDGIDQLFVQGCPNRPSQFPGLPAGFRAGNGPHGGLAGARGGGGRHGPAQDAQKDPNFLAICQLIDAKVNETKKALPNDITQTWRWDRPDALRNDITTARMSRSESWGFKWVGGVVGSAAAGVTKVFPAVAFISGPIATGGGAAASLGRIDENHANTMIQGLEARLDQLTSQARGCPAPKQ